MTLAGQVSLTIAVVVTAAAVCAWIFGVFHLVMLQVRVWEAKPTFREALSGQFQPEISQVHRRMFNRAVFTFMALIVLAILVGLIGAASGGWR